jgi:hypothetical protein
MTRVPQLNSEKQKHLCGRANQNDGRPAVHWHSPFAALQQCAIVKAAWRRHYAESPTNWGWTGAANPQSFVAVGRKGRRGIVRALQFANPPVSSR